MSLGRSPKYSWTKGEGNPRADVAFIYIYLSMLSVKVGIAVT